MLTKDHYII